jgi:hypothetical protein
MIPPYCKGCFFIIPNETDYNCCGFPIEDISPPCPCINCIVKSTCLKQCSKHQSFFTSENMKIITSYISSMVGEMIKTCENHG